MDNEMASNEMPTDGDIIEIEPIEDYNAQKARLRASLLWLLHKAYPDEIPTDLREIFYETGEGHLHILPHLMNKLVSSDVYCLACASLFKDTAYQWQGHWSIIQVLSRKGIYVMETEDVAVTATVLVQTAPFRINAHLALIDALMTAYTSEVLSVQNVVQAVRKFTTFNASSDLPSTVEDAAVFWLNKVGSTILQRQEEERKVQQQQLIQGETTQKVRITRKQLSPKEFPVIGPVKDLVEDCSDGCSLAAGISFYCPQHLKLNDICLKKCLGIADSLFNLRLVKTFCERHVPTRCFHFEYVDLLYSNKSLRMNILAFVAELFYWFELEKVHCVTDGTRPSTASRLAGTSTTIPISEVTRRSFHKVTDPAVSQLDPAHTASSPASHLPPRQILLPKRVQDDSCVPEPHSSRQQTHTSGGRSAHQSILAWQDDSEPQQDRRAHRRGSNRSPQPTSAPVTSEHSPGLSESQGSHLLANVSIDSEVMESYRSVDLEGLDESLNIEASGSRSVSPSVRTHKGSPGKEPINYDNVEILNISASGTSTQMSTQMGLRSSVHSPKGDPLLPARIKAAKEKVSNHSKAEERGDSSYKKQSHPVIKKGTFRVSPDAQTVVAQSGDSFVKVSSESSGSCPSEDMVITPLPPEQLDDVPVPVPSHSYTIPDVVSTPQEAISAGIPVVSQSEVNGRMCSSNMDVRVRSRQSSVTSNRSSGEFSDHESQKIHLDHKSRESAMTKEMSPSRSTQQIDPRPDSLNVVKPIIIESGIQKSPIIMSDESKKLLGHTTNFAQIKKLRDDGQYDNSGYVFMQHGQESNGSGGNKMSLKAAFQRKQAESNKPDKRTTFATLPNQTTWQQSAQRLQSAGSSAQQPVENGDVAQPLSSELMQVRLKLEEKRRVIEREKHRMELQKSKQRQRLGKAAFMHVLSKKEGKENAIQEQGEATMTRSAEERVSPLPPGASSAMSTSQPAYSEPMSEINSSSGAGRPARSFSREGIQNTIENVRKKWFGDQNGDYSTSLANHSKPTASAVHEAKAEANIHRLSDATRPHGMQRATPPLDTRATPPLDARVTPPIDSRMTPPLQQDLSGGSTKAKILARMTPPLQSSSDPRQSPRQTPPLDRQSPPQHQAQPPRVSQTSPISISANTKKTSGKEGETYEEYNSSLDKLNNSLSELQGEIMRLSLKQERLKNSTNEPVGPVVPVPTVVRSGLKASVSPQPRITPPPANLWQQSHGISKPGIPTDAPGSYSSVTQPYTSPPAIHQQVNPQAPQSQFIMHGQPAGNYPTNTAFTSPNQYPPGGYIPGQQPPFNLQSPQMYPQMYQQSPPFGGQPGTAPFMMHMPPTAGMTGQPYLPPTAPGGQFQPPMSVPGYPQHPQYSGTYTVPSHTHPHPAPSSATTAVPQQRQQTFQDVPGRGSPYTVSHFQTNTQSLPEEPIPSGGNVHMEDSVPVTQRTEIQQPHLDTRTVVHSTPEGQTIPQEDVSSAGGNEGFFVSFGADTPKRSKPKLGSERVKDESAVRALSMDRPSTPKYNESYSISRGSNSPSPVVNSHNESSDHNTSGIGFVIGEDNTSMDKSLEDEMQRKREKMIQLQQKRRDEQERKRQEKELQDAERKEKERRKQEEAELRKADEKARRDAIFQKYKERKAKDDQDEMEEVRPRKDRPRDRPRPKSMIVKTRTTVGQNGGGPVRAGNSHDDLHTSSNAALSAPSPVPTGRITPKRGKLYRPASCHLMDTTDGDPRTAIPSSGSLTHRRPPSPDLYARFQNRKAMSARGTDSNSETGSTAGSDYAGPKLYVKPSQKSNRHIIVNAISHVCLAGTVNTDIKNKVLEEMSRSEAKHFLILFRSNGCQFRGLYTFDPETELSFKLTGAGPKQLTNKAIETFYKYNSGAKKFNVVASTKHISVSIDAVVAHNSVWKPAKQPANKR